MFHQPPDRPPSSGSVSVEEAAAVLVRVAKGEVMAQEVDAHTTLDRIFKTSDGWKFTIFDDVGEMDYLDSIEAPDGRKGTFDDWVVSDDDHFSCNNPLDHPSVNDRDLAAAIGWKAGSDYV